MESQHQSRAGLLLRLHNLQHAQRLTLSSGIPPQVVMKWTGHCDYKSMKPYIDIAGKTKSDAMNTFANSLSF